MKRMKLNIVEIELPNGDIATYDVMHYDPRQARAWLLEEKVTARKPSDLELIAFGREGRTAMGPEEAQMDLEHAIDAENRRNAAVITGEQP